MEDVKLKLNYFQGKKRSFTHLSSKMKRKVCKKLLKTHLRLFILLSISIFY